MKARLLSNRAAAQADMSVVGLGCVKTQRGVTAIEWTSLQAHFRPAAIARLIANCSFKERSFSSFVGV
jgi:hypothetical protein